jgi:hypothetical protein
MVEEHVRLGQSRSSRRPRQRRLPRSSLLFHNSGSLQEVHRERSHTRSSAVGHSGGAGTSGQRHRIVPLPRYCRRDCATTFANCLRNFRTWE